MYLERKSSTIAVIIAQDHIDRGQPGECNLCPIALSLYDAGHEYVSVDDQFVALGVGLDRREYQLPSKARHWITDYDNGRVQAPITFEMTEIYFEEV